jgi:hypothetical protein
LIIRVTSKLVSASLAEVLHVATCSVRVLLLVLQGPWISRQALHAWSLTLQHTGTGQQVTFSAPPPDDFAAAAAALGLTLPQQ